MLEKWSLWNETLLKKVEQVTDTKLKDKPVMIFLILFLIWFSLSLALGTMVAIIFPSFTPLAWTVVIDGAVIAVLTAGFMARYY